MGGAPGRVLYSALVRAEAEQCSHPGDLPQTWAKPQAA